MSRKFYIAYAAMMFAVAAISIGIGASIASTTHTKIVTKTKTVPATFNGQASLVAFLGQPQQVQCPDGFQGAVCLQWSGSDHFVFAAVPAGQ